MKLTWDQRQARREWARRNPDKVRESNRRWRLGREALLRRQARERMRRWRAKRKERSRPLPHNVTPGAGDEQLKVSRVTPVPLEVQVAGYSGVRDRILDAVAAIA